MKFLKKLQLAKKNVSDDRIAVDGNSLVYFESTNAIKLPFGTTAQQPGQSSNTITSPANGMLRYNTTTNEIEAYQNTAWRNVRFKEATTITQQSAGNGDGTITIFGPLSPVPTSAQNSLVLVENVLQLATTNYTLNQNPSSTGTGQEVNAGSFAISTSYIITVVGTTSFTSIGASANTVGTVFTATAAGTGTGKARRTGWYLTFTGAVPLGKPVTILHGFDQ